MSFLDPFDAKKVAQRADEFIKHHAELPPELKPFESFLPTLLKDKEIIAVFKKATDAVYNENKTSNKKKQEYFGMQEIQALEQLKALIEKKMTASGFTGFDDLNVIQLETCVREIFWGYKDLDVMEKRSFLENSNLPYNTSGHHHISYIPPQVPNAKAGNSEKQDSTKTR